MLYFYACGMISFFSSVIIGNIKVWLFSNTHSILSLFLIFGSIVFYISNHAIVSNMSNTFDVYNTFSVTFSSLNFWVVIIITQGLTMMIELGIYRIENQRLQQRLKKLKQI